MNHAISFLIITCFAWAAQAQHEQDRIAISMNRSHTHGSQVLHPSMNTVLMSVDTGSAYASFIVEYTSPYDDIILSNFMSFDANGNIMIPPRDIAIPPSFTFDIFSGQIGVPANQATLVYRAIDANNAYLEPGYNSNASTTLIPLQFLTVPAAAFQLTSPSVSNFHHYPNRAFSFGEDWSMMTSVNLPGQSLMLRFELAVQEDNDSSTGISALLYTEAFASMNGQSITALNTQGLVSYDLIRRYIRLNMFAPTQQLMTLEIHGTGHEEFQAVRIAYITL